MTDEELKNKCKERAKIFQQAMESCRSSNPMDCIEWFADRIAELENRQLEKEKCELLGIIQGKDKAIAELEEENRQLKNEVEDLTAYCNQIGKIKTGVLKLFEHIVAR